MCEVGGKKWNHYYSNNATVEFTNELCANTGIPVIKLIESTKGRYGGTWIHPKLAIHLAQWISPKFGIWVTDLVIRYASGDLTLAQDVVRQANRVSGQVNNVELKTNPDNLTDVVGIATTTDPGSTVARSEYDAMVMKMKILELERDNA